MNSEAGCKFNKVKTGGTIEQDDLMLPNNRYPGYYLFRVGNPYIQRKLEAKLIECPLGAIKFVFDADCWQETTATIRIVLTVRALARCSRVLGVSIVYFPVFLLVSLAFSLPGLFNLAE